ncbi:MAG: flagellar hook-basal body protein [Solirubrobacteraceae bacterium]|nr:flagellar hook-basal body protein [Solirubrobacteraceae bacterium]
MYAAAAGMIAQQTRLDALSSDIANVNTPGYKPLRQGFRDLLYSDAGIATTNGAQVGAGAALTGLGRSDSQGNIVPSDNNLDIAVSGPGYFQVRNAKGDTLLTRNGHLQIDAQGRLAQQDGNLLQPIIQLPKGTQQEQVSIAANGAVAVDGKAVGQIRLVNVQAPSKLAPRGNDTFQASAESGPARAAGNETTVMQGTIETSGVQLSDAMTEMIQTQRAYQLASRAITTQDKVAEAAIGVKR